MSKRYLQWGYDSFKDTKTGEISDNHIHILNKQAERIAELEEQLKNAIVPKFKVGQEYWFLYAGDVKKGTVFMLHIDKGGIVYESYVDDTRYSICSKCDNVFATKEEAQAKLKELQGE